MKLQLHRNLQTTDNSNFKLWLSDIRHSMEGIFIFIYIQAYVRNFKWIQSRPFRKIPHWRIYIYIRKYTTKCTLQTLDRYAAFTHQLPKGRKISNQKSRRASRIMKSIKQIHIGGRESKISNQNSHKLTKMKHEDYEFQCNFDPIINSKK